MSDMLTKESASVSAGGDDTRQYLSEIRRYPRLTPEQERELAMRCAQGDEDAIRQMVNANLRLVVSIAQDYDGRGVPLLDLIQEGSFGLLVAAKRFDYTKEFRFSTYATDWIRQYISRYLADHSTSIRVPAYTAQKIRNVKRIRTKLLQENGAEPGEEALAEACGLSVEKLRQLMQLHPEICSLDASLGEEDSTIGTILEDVNAPQPYETLVREELNQTMDALLNMLDERQKWILQMHFGMTDGVCHSLEEISKQLGISKERTRQIERQAMDKLKKMGVSMGLEDYLE